MQHEKCPDRPGEVAVKWWQNLFTFCSGHCIIKVLRTLMFFRCVVGGMPCADGFLQSCGAFLFSFVHAFADACFDKALFARAPLQFLQNVRVGSLV